MNLLVSNNETKPVFAITKVTYYCMVKAENCRILQLINK